MTPGITITLAHQPPNPSLVASLERCPHGVLRLLARSVVVLSYNTTVVSAGSAPPCRAEEVALPTQPQQTVGCWCSPSLGNHSLSACDLDSCCSLVGVEALERLELRKGWKPPVRRISPHPTKPQMSPNVKSALSAPARRRRRPYTFAQAWIYTPAKVA